MTQSETVTATVPPLKLLLTIAEAAAALSLSRRFFYVLVMTNKVKTIKLGRSRRVPVQSLPAFIDSQLQVS